MFGIGPVPAVRLAYRAAHRASRVLAAKFSRLAWAIAALSRVCCLSQGSTHSLSASAGFAGAFFDFARAIASLKRVCCLTHASSIESACAGFPKMLADFFQTKGTRCINKYNIVPARSVGPRRQLAVGPGIVVQPPGRLGVVQIPDRHGLARTVMLGRACVRRRRRYLRLDR